MATRDQRRSKPSRRELELSEAEKRKIVEKYGLDIEDYDDFVALGERPGELYAGGMEGFVPVAPYRVDDGRSAAWISDSCNTS